VEAQVIEGIVLAAIAGGLGIVLTFILTRNREVNNLARQNIASTAGTFEIIETLKTVVFLQGQRIDNWEEWGAEIQRPIKIMRDTLRSNGWNGIPEIPTAPEAHLDLRPYWKHIDEAIEDMKPHGIKEHK
jgi:hypothetical protein